jgi:hypothetical protein
MRIEIQHRLLSFPTTSEVFCTENPISEIAHSNVRWTTKEIEQSYIIMAVTELIWLAAAVYSDRVIFPWAWVLGVKAGLASRMRNVYQASGMHQGPVQRIIASTKATEADSETSRLLL